MRRIITFLAFLLIASCSLSGQTVNNARMLSGVNYIYASTYTFVPLDATRLTTFTSSSATAVTLPSSSFTGFGAGYLFSVRNQGTGTVTITPASGFISGASTLVLATGQGADIYGDGINYSVNLGAGSGGGGGSPGAPINSVQCNVSSTFGACNATDNGTVFAIKEDSQIQGPNPAGVDIRAYGARAGINPTTLTGTISGTSTALTLSAAGPFINGDGIDVLGAGATLALSTPNAPTVVPSLARVGTGTGDVVNGPTCSTTYHYKYIAIDYFGGYTPASPSTTITNGCALGPQPITLVSCTRSGAAVSCINSGSNGLVANAEVQIYLDATDGAWAGKYQVSSVADSTHFSLVTSNTTANGAIAATSASFSGTAYAYSSNHITWTELTGEMQYAVYSDRASTGTFAFIGVTHPVNVSSGLTDDEFDDFGSPMMDSLAAYRPWYIPATAPSSGQNDLLVTTITAGAGTTNVTVANAATNSVSGATLRFDNTPAILAAATAAGSYPIVIPHTSGFYVNSPIYLNHAAHSIQVNGPLILNSQLVMGPFSTLTGDRSPEAGTCISFSFQCFVPIYTNVSPSIWWFDSTSSYITGVTLLGGPNSLLFDVFGGFPDARIGDLNVQSGDGSGNDYMGIGVLERGVNNMSANQDISSQTIDHLVALSTSPQTSGLSDTPEFYCMQCGNINAQFIQLGSRGTLFRSGPAGMWLTLRWIYGQGTTSSLVTTTGQLSGGGGTGGVVDIQEGFPDTAPNPVYSNLRSGAAYTPTLKLNVYFGPSSGVVPVTGSPLAGISGYGASGQNYNLGIIQGDSVIVAGTQGNSVSYNANSPYTNPATPSIGWLLPTPAAPSLVASGGGSVPVGAHAYQIMWVDNLGNTSAPGVAAAITIAGGTQTVTVTPQSVPAQAVNYIVVIDGDVLYLGGHCMDATSVSAATVHSSALGCGIGIPSDSTALGSGTGSGVVLGTDWYLNNGGFSSHFAGTFTSNRTINVPNLSGTLALSNAANTFSSNNSFTGTNTFTHQIVSSIITGTAPFSVASITPVSNLTLFNHPTVQSCGTSAACSPVAITASQVVYGSAALSSGTPSTVTITAMSPAFTSSSTYFCTFSNITNAADNLLKFTPVSGSSFTITGPNTITDTIGYICAGN